MSLGGTEIVNASRTLAYLRTVAPGLKMTGCGECADLGRVLGDGEYASPLVDQPDWFDAENPDTWNFAGFYPLSVVGLDDSTRVAPVLDSLADGGSVGRVRHGPREIRVSGLLIAADECSLEVGRSWLKKALDGNPCRDAAGGCEGDDLCVMSCCPQAPESGVDPDSEQIANPVSLTVGWTEQSGSWVAGSWQNATAPSAATGPAVTPPCDDVRYEFLLDPTGEGRVVRFSIRDDAGTVLAFGPTVDVRRVNWIDNPSFHQNTDGWVDGGDDIVLVKTPGLPQATATVAVAQPADQPLVSVGVNASGVTTLPVTAHSARVTVQSTVTACLRLALTYTGPTELFHGEPVTLEPGVPVTLTLDGAQTVDLAPDAAELSVVPCEGESLPAGVFTVSQALVERAPAVGDYFDGETPDANGYERRWLGVPNQAPSEAAFTGPAEIMIEAGEADVRPAIEILRGDGVDVASVTFWAREEASPEDCFDGYARTLRKVTVIDGPRVIEKFDSCAAMERVEFTMVAAVPWQYQTLAPGFDVVDDGEFGETVIPAEDDCPTEDPLAPLNDPDCPLPPSPPRPPVPEGCVVDVGTYVRRAVAIPGDLLMPWQEAVPVVTLDVQTNQAVRQARVRFYPNPLNRTNLQDIDLCSYCGEFIVSYIPPYSQIVVDGMTERAVVTRPGDVQFDATHLLYGTGGGPMEWPLLTCGLPYIMTVDTMPETTLVVTTSLELAVRG